MTASQSLDVTAPLAGSGAAAGPDSARVAVRGALRSLAPGTARLVLLFGSSSLGPARSAALGQQEAGDVPVVGLTGDACLGAPGVVRGGCVALALADPVRAGVATRKGAGRDLREAARSASAEALAALGEATAHTALLLLLDARSGDQAEAVAGAYEVAGPAVPLAGGGAAGHPTGQFAHGRSLEDAVVAVALGSPRPIALGLSHGCRMRDVPCIVTASEGNVVQEIDGRPAADVYLERLGRAGERLSPDAFADLAAVHPLAQPELSGDLRLRHVRAREPGGGLLCATHIPANAALHIMEQTQSDIVDSAPRAAAAAADGLRGAPMRAAVAFDCAGRQHALGDALEHEARALLRGFGSVPPPVAGVYTRGEIGRLRGAKGDRNHALVVVGFA